MGNKKAKNSFIGKISKYGKDRKHIEIPKNKRKDFKTGVYVNVNEIK